MARDRKRAKQRRERRGAASAPGAGRTQAPSASDGLRADVPGALGHASAEVDEFDAALLRGAGGVPAPAELDGPEGAAPGLLEPGVGGEGQVVADPDLDELADGGDDLLQGPGGAGGNGGSGAGNSGGGHSGGGSHERPSGAPLRGGNRAVGFLRASWAELQRVQWPDRRHVTQATAVVLGFVAIAGAYLGLADYVAKELVEFIL